MTHPILLAPWNLMISALGATICPIPEPILIFPVASGKFQIRFIPLSLRSPLFTLANASCIGILLYLIAILRAFSNESSVLTLLK